MLKFLKTECIMLHCNLESESVSDKCIILSDFVDNIVHHILTCQY